ncbi:MBL fold metallo-hydrolase [Labedella endophytica]|uniref:MBL fold metallo-hydrolase n=1 Tax=Labedella endophytica TaxID=1523160 RepID=A0A3S0VRB7_9MICO|nr:MBL fold metallo-hydrolase [Labedella endophytica]RUQ97610.1 MBL fold metallo-hydrolase [Labedella endophytica]
MQLTKLEHAALILDEAGRRLFIDPGAFTTAITDGTRADAIVITHEHPDHWTREQLDRIIAASPGVTVYAPAGVAAAAGDLPITVVAHGDEVTVGSFRLRFFGRKHAVIHESIPVVDNVGVLVNEALYYAGDSFTVPDGVDVNVLAAPAGAPWMKVSETIDYVLAVKPRHAFPTHEMVLSRAGKDMSNARLQWATEQGGGTFHALEPGDVLSI